MNKNWLYRILAIALVAMLALPVFAMAEEAEFELGGEEGVELIEKAPYAPPEDPVNEPGDDDFPSAKTQVWEWDFSKYYGTSYSCTVDVDVANPEHYTNYWFDAQGLMSGFSKKNTKNSVATVDRDGNIKIKKAGTTVITYSGKDVYSRKVSLKITLNVKNTAKITLKDATCSMYMTPDPMHVALNDADKAIYTWAGGEQEIATGDDDTTFFVNFTSSSKSVATVLRYDTTDPGYGDVKTKKIGSTKVTAKLYRIDDGNIYQPFELAKATAKLKVVANKWVNSDSKIKDRALAYAKAKDMFIIGIEKAEYVKKNADGTYNVKLDFYLANGTEWSIKKMWGLNIDSVAANVYDNAYDREHYEVAPEKEGTTYTIAQAADKAITCNAKKGKIGKFSITLTNQADIVDLANANTMVFLPYDAQATFSMFKNGEPTHLAWKQSY